jgi:hypothetical protein
VERGYRQTEGSSASTGEAELSGPGKTYSGWNATWRPPFSQIPASKETLQLASNALISVKLLRLPPVTLEWLSPKNSKEKIVNLQLNLVYKHNIQDNFNIILPSTLKIFLFVSLLQIFKLRISYILLISPLHAICPTHISLIDLMNLTMINPNSARDINRTF